MRPVDLIPWLFAAAAAFVLGRGTYRAVFGRRSRGFRWLVAAVALLAVAEPAVHRRPWAVGVLAILALGLVAYAVVRADHGGSEDPVASPEGDVVEPRTELEQAEQLHATLLAYVDQIDLDDPPGGYGAQAALAHHIAAVASELHQHLDVVFRERHQLRASHQ